MCMNHRQAAQLQTEVTALKQQLARALRINKAGPHQPFPLSLVYAIDLPDSAYDVSHLQAGRLPACSTAAVAEH